MLPGTVGLCWDGAVGTHPLLGAGEWHSLAHLSPLGGHRGVVEVLCKWPRTATCC